MFGEKLLEIIIKDVIAFFFLKLSPLFHYWLFSVIFPTPNCPHLIFSKASIYRLRSFGAKEVTTGTTCCKKCFYTRPHFVLQLQQTNRKESVDRTSQNKYWIMCCTSLLHSIFLLFLSFSAKWYSGCVHAGTVCCYHLQQKYFKILYFSQLYSSDCNYISLRLPNYIWGKLSVWLSGAVISTLTCNHQ